ncbi:MAG: Planctomycete cytochrome [Planctomycetaceae bacterium]|nr:Planctomycete cytochrome [Planctomycetaceae bacterium]
MRKLTWFSLIWLLAFGLLWSGAALPVGAAITPDQRKELGEVRKEVGKVAGHLAKKEFEEARKILNDAQEKVSKIASDAKVMETDKTLAPILLQIEKQRAALDKKAGGAGEGGINFDKEVAPILAAKCANCHNEDRSSGGLKLDTFAGLEAGGTNKPLLVQGQGARSLLVMRLTANGPARMPKAPQPALSAAEIASITSWVNQGAKYEGDKTKKFQAAAAGGAARGNNLPVPAIVRAAGNEKVSFKRDIAPFMVNLCVGCHSGNNARGGLNLTTFEGLMKGGQSGRVILPGNMEGSRLFRLVGGLELPRMPQGQARITRTNYENLKTWFEEGNKFDGPDPKQPLRELVPTEAEMIAAKLAKLSPEEFNAMRKEKSEDQWKRSNSKETANTVESADYLVMGNASEDRLKEVLGWADEHAKTLRAAFGAKTDEIWKGKLAIFVFKDRFSFEEFPRVIDSAEVPRETIGLSKVSPSFDEAYVCVEDIGDQVSSESPGMKLSVIDQITGAYLKRSGDKIPEWLIRGLGLALASKDDKKNEFILAQPAMAVQSLQGLESPEQVFEKGKFSSADLGPVGFTLVQHMMAAGGPGKLGMLIDKLQSGAELAAALKDVYNADLKTLGMSYGNMLGNRKPGKVKKK